MATLRVPQDYSTIQAAINAANNGDTVLVANGTYAGTGNKELTWSGKVITVRSVNGPDNCIIDCENSGNRAFYFSNAGNCGTISGFTMRNGNPSQGGGIWCDNSSPAITNCTISGNSATYGGGIFCYNSSSPAITNCIISGNSASDYGGGIYCWYSSPAITNCIISGNSASDYGGGIYCWYSSPAITNCTISGNSATYGGGIFCYNSSSPAITNCIISDNSNYGIYEYDNSSDPPTNYNCFWNNTSGDYYDEGTTPRDVAWLNTQGTGNLSADPLFISSSDFHLQATSPCIDAGSNTAPAIPSTDKDGKTRIVDGNEDGIATVDMGAYEYGDVYIITKDTNGQWAVSDSFKTQLAKLQGTKPRWGSFLGRKKPHQAIALAGETLASLSSSNKQAQKITLNQDTTFSGVWVRACLLDMGAPLTTCLCNNNAGVPGAIITSTSIAASEIPSSSSTTDWLWVQFTTKQSLSAGIYFLTFEGGEGFGAVQIAYVNNTYTDGNRLYSTDGGTNWTNDTNTDIAFRLEVLSGGEWEEIKLENTETGLVNVGQITKQVERELLTYVAGSATLDFSNVRGYWNPKGGIKNTKGKPIQGFYRTSETSLTPKGIFLLPRGEYKISFTDASTCVVNGVSYTITGNEVRNALGSNTTIKLNPNRSLSDKAIIRLGIFTEWKVFLDRLRLWKGFEINPNWKEFIPAFTGLVQDISIIKGMSTISAIDYDYNLQKVTAEKVTMDNSDGTLTTKLNVSDEIPDAEGGGKGLLKTATKIPVLPPIDKFPSSGKIRIDEEIITYTSKIETTDDTSFNGCTRGADLTTAVAHKDGAEVKNYQWYIAPRMDRAVERLMQEAGISDYQIDQTITNADFEHFSYHGKTPSMPPFGVARCMCYDATQDQYWFGIDNKLYLWKDGVWTLKKTLGVGIGDVNDWIYKIAVWENNGNVYFVTSRKHEIFTAWYRTPYNNGYDAHTGLNFDLWKYDISSDILSIYSTVNKPMYASTLGCYVTSSYVLVQWVVESRKAFYIFGDRLYYIYCEDSISSSAYKGIAYIDLISDTIVTLLTTQFVAVGCINFSSPCLNSWAIITLQWDIVYRLNFLFSPPTVTFLKDFPGDVAYFGIGTPELEARMEEVVGGGQLVKLVYTTFYYTTDGGTVNYWRICSIRFSTPDTPEGDTTSYISWREIKRYSNYDAITLDNVDDGPRSFARQSGGSRVYFALGTGYKSGSAHKLYQIIDISPTTDTESIVDIGIPIAGEKGQTSDMLLVSIGGIEILYAVSYPSYILWQYSKEAVISAFNQTDFRANYGITRISNIIKDLAEASGFKAYFDELGIFYFQRPETSGNVKVAFAEKDIKSLSVRDGDLSAYPIINKCVVSLLQGNTKIYELSETSLSRQNYGLEVLSISNAWLNNEGVAYGLAKRMVELYQLPSNLATLDLRWYP
ncbi:MAG: right-handed parallel beta-helix repeat-containing protein, partial [bacterium]